MARKKYRYFACDFETTVYDEQEFTEVWASALCELYTEDVKVFGSIEETFDYFARKIQGNVILYYHNLKFDGSFWISFLLTKLNYKQAFMPLDDKGNMIAEADEDMENNSFKYMISDMGQWYTITIKTNKKYIVIRDSLKLMPFSLREIGKSFRTKHKKLDMEYKGFRYSGCEITDEERKYIENDVLVLKEALEIMFNDGHNKLTIGSCCIEEFKTIIGADWDAIFPSLYEMKIDPLEYGASNVDEYIRKSYKGGWCYLVKGKESIHYNKLKRGFTTGVTADVNSLYPSMMHSESGNYYPVGRPIFWKGEIPNFILDNDEYYYFVRIATHFISKFNMLPCIQIKNDFRYSPTEWLTTSDIFNHKTGEYKSRYINYDGTIEDSIVVLTLTKTDWELIQKHYTLTDLTILDGCYFRAEIGIFDEYIDKYKKIKLESEGAQRTEAKLFLNNLYGRLAISSNSSFKYAYVKEDGSIGYYMVEEFNKKPCYIAGGTAITSYARRFTITAAQNNFYGFNKPGFIYADTDSIHCDLLPSQLKNVPVHSRDFCHWKLEGTWNEAIFIRQKCYIEHIIQENLEDIENPYYNIKCAGLPEESKKLLNYSFTECPKDVYENLSEDKQKFVSKHRRITDFKVGLQVPGKLLPKTIRGGIVLIETPFTMR